MFKPNIQNGILTSRFDEIKTHLNHQLSFSPHSNEGHILVNDKHYNFEVDEDGHLYSPEKLDGYDYYDGKSYLGHYNEMTFSPYFNYNKGWRVLDTDDNRSKVMKRSRANFNKGVKKLAAAREAPFQRVPSISSTDGREACRTALSMAIRNIYVRMYKTKFKDYPTVVALSGDRENDLYYTDGERRERGTEPANAEQIRIIKPILMTGKKLFEEYLAGYGEGRELGMMPMNESENEKLKNREEYVNVAGFFGSPSEEQVRAAYAVAAEAQSYIDQRSGDESSVRGRWEARAAAKAMVDKDIGSLNSWGGVFLTPFEYLASIGCDLSPEKVRNTNAAMNTDQSLFEGLTFPFMESLKSEVERVPYGLRTFRSDSQVLGEL